MLTCRDVLERADAYLANEMTPWQRVGFRVHLSLCRNCRRYLKQLRLTQTVSVQIPLTTHEPSAEQLEAIFLKIQQQDD